jgi:hypothetical protein
MKEALVPVTRDSITDAYAQYVSAYPAEAERLTLLTALLLYSQEEPAESTTLPAHVIARAVLLGPDGTVLGFPVGDRLAFPGDHTAPDDTSLMDTACRSLAEVTTLPLTAFTPMALQAGTPLDYSEEETIDGHLHRVFYFLLALSLPDRDDSIRRIGERVNDFRWIPMSEFAPQQRLYTKLSQVAQK